MKIRHGISVPLFAVLWLVVCSATAVAAFRFPIRYKTNKEKQLMHQFVASKNNRRCDPGRNRFSAVPEIFEGVPGAIITGDSKKIPAQKDEKEEILAMLCSFLTNGSVDTAKRIFPSEVIDSLIDKYAVVIGMLGGEDAAMKYALSKSLLSELGVKGQIKSVDFEILDTAELDRKAIKKIEKQLADLNDEGVFEVEQGVRVMLKLLFQIEKTSGDIECASVKKEFILYRSESQLRILPFGILPKGLVS